MNFGKNQNSQRRYFASPSSVSHAAHASVARPQDPRYRNRSDDGEQPFDGAYLAGAGRYTYEHGRGWFVTTPAEQGVPHQVSGGVANLKASDDLIVEELSERLERSQHVDADAVEVSCRDGVVRLRGKVEDRHAKRRAEECADGVYGVVDLFNELQVDRSFFGKLFRPIRGGAPARESA